MDANWRANYSRDPYPVKVETYNWLTALCDRFQDRKLGRICQKLLALALRSAGYDHVVEREVQGVDVDAARLGGPRYAIEVKTTKKAVIVLGEKDFVSLKQRRADGYELVIAILRLSPISDWLAVDATRLSRGSYQIERLTAYSLKELQGEIRASFGEVVARFAPHVLEEGPSYLDAELRRLRIETVA